MPYQRHQTRFADQYLFPQPGRKVPRIGEAVLLHKCKPITDYHVHWNQSHNGTCYSAFPVTSTSFTGIQFLELGRRNIGRHANKVSCDGVDNDTYIADKDNNIWHKHKTTFRKIKKYNVPISNDHIGLVKIAPYGASLRHYNEEPPSRNSLLFMLARSKEVLEQLEHFRSHGGGSVLAGIGSLLGGAIHSLASGSSMIIKTIGEGIRDIFHGVGDLDEKVVGSISNATSTVISTGATGISQILDSIGGPSGIILYILVFGLYAYVIYSRYDKTQPFLFNFGSRKGDTEKAELVPPSPTRERKIQAPSKPHRHFGDDEHPHLLPRCPQLRRPLVTSIRTSDDEDPISPTYNNIW